MREWEQGHCQPEAPTRVLLVASRPEVIVAGVPVDPAVTYTTGH